MKILLTVKSVVGTVRQGSRLMIKPLASLPLAASILLCIAVLAGCTSMQTQQLLFDASLARIIILERPPGPQRDQILREFDAAVLAGNLLLAEEKAQEASKLVPPVK